MSACMVDEMFLRRAAVDNDGVGQRGWGHSAAVAIAAGTEAFWRVFVDPC